MKNLTEALQNPIFNSLTKYPSILTYHKIDKGILQEKLSFPTHEDLELYVTEKINGSNIRMIIYNNDYLIGSREEWTYAKGDRVVETKVLKFLSNYVEEALKSYSFKEDTLYCIYGEIHGSHIMKSWKHYTLTPETYDIRIFDIWSMNLKHLESLMVSMSVSNDASHWRENNNQPWWTMDEISTFIIESEGFFKYAPFKTTYSLKYLPTDLKETYEFLKKYKNTDINLDGNYKHNAQAEGIVIRSHDRHYIAKLRFEDYEKTFKKLKKGSEKI